MPTDEVRTAATAVFRLELGNGLLRRTSDKGHRPGCWIEQGHAIRSEAIAFVKFGFEKAI